MSTKDELRLPEERQENGRTGAQGTSLAQQSVEDQRSREKRSRDRSDQSKQKQEEDRELKEVSHEIHRTLMKNRLVSDIDTKDVLHAVAKLVQKKKKKLEKMDPKNRRQEEDKAGEARTPTGSHMKSARKGSFDSPKQQFESIVNNSDQIT